MSKVLFAWPPIKSEKGYPCLAQNRQFQFYKSPTFIYPITAGYCATMLAKKGHTPHWLDCIAEELGESDFSKSVISIMPDYIVFEASTPVIERYWEIINDFKEQYPNIKIILCGDHVTALPEESSIRCKADYIIQGGKWQYDVFKLVHGEAWEGLLPHIERNGTRWWLYGYRNGNYKYIPGTYIMSAQDCWHRPGCTFCSWATYHQEYDVRPVEDVLTEIEFLVQMGFKEIYDDSGTFPTGEWLKEFCTKVKERGYHEHVSFGCNMRFGSLDDSDFGLLADAGFRMVLWGLESVNQRTLDMLNKGYDVKQISPDLIKANAAGLQSHLTVMFGYPWESYEEAKRTYDMVKTYLLNGYAWSAQATICIPYPSTPLWHYCKKNNLLLTEEWSRYDMTEPVMSVPYSYKELFALQRGIYNTAFHPKFIWNKLRAIRCMEDLKYYLRIGQKLYNKYGDWSEVSKEKVE